MEIKPAFSLNLRVIKLLYAQSAVMQKQMHRIEDPFISGI